MPEDPDAAGSPATWVVATAGHVDHGKSSLILRLTGMDPDRLEEEKLRGLTIALGYAWCTLPSGREVGFVDVPGHERFVRTMLAGVGPVRLVIFVVAADEGWKPQSEEHLDIVDVLGVDGVVIALTKSDLVSPHRLALAQEEIRGHVGGTTLEGAPIVACSSRTGDGLDDLVTALDAMLATAPEPERDARSRQHVDRVFTIKGSGTVVTGTLTGGPIAVGEEVELLPSGARSRVRTLQTHHRDVGVVLPVSRVAANLAGVSRGGIERGEVVTHPDAWRPTDVFECRVRTVRSLGRPLTARGAFKFHAGSAERDARIRIYGATSVARDGAFARIRLAEPLVLDVGDRFVLRESGRRETVGGGVVLDVDPPRRPGSDAAERLSRRERAERGEVPALLVRERGAIGVADVRLLTGLSPLAIAGATRSSGWWIADHLRDEAARATQRHLEAFHADQPLALGQELPQLRADVMRSLRAAGAPNDEDLAGAVIDALVQEGRLAREGTSVRLSSHVAETATAEQTRLLDAIRDGEPTPPSVSELQAAGFERGLIDALVRSGELVRIAPDLVLSAGLVQRAEAIVRAAGERGVTVSAIREGLSTSRRYAVPLMEHLDRTGVTRRSGDLRFARRP